LQLHEWLLNHIPVRWTKVFFSTFTYVCTNFSFCTVILHNSMDYGFYPLWKLLKRRKTNFTKWYIFFFKWFQNKMQHVNYGFLSLWKFVIRLSTFFLYEYTKVCVEHTPTNH
jgi:hypothetical protein